MLYSFDCSAGVLQVSGGALSCSDAAGTLTVTPVAYAIDTTDPSTGFSDGLTLGWGIAAAMVAAYGIHVLRRAL